MLKKFFNIFLLLISVNMLSSCNQAVDEQKDNIDIPTENEEELSNDQNLNDDQSDTNSSNDSSENDVNKETDISLIRDYKPGSYFAKKDFDDYELVVNLVVGNDYKISAVNIERYRKLEVYYNDGNYYYYVAGNDDVYNSYRLIDVNADFLTMPTVDDVINANDINADLSENASKIANLIKKELYLPLKMFYANNPYDIQMSYLEKRLILDNSTYGIIVNNGVTTNVDNVTIDCSEECSLVQGILNSILVKETTLLTDKKGLYIPGDYHYLSEVNALENELYYLTVNDEGYISHLRIDKINGDDKDLSKLINLIIQNQSIKSLNYSTKDGFGLSLEEVLEKVDGNYKYDAYIEGIEEPINYYIDNLNELFKQVKTISLNDGIYSSYNDSGYVTIEVKNAKIAKVYLDEFVNSSDIKVTISGKEYPLYEYRLDTLDSDLQEITKTYYVYQKNDSYYYAYDYLDIGKVKEDKVSELEMTPSLVTHYVTIRQDLSAASELDKVVSSLIGQKNIYNINQSDYKYIDIQNINEALVKALTNSNLNEQKSDFVPVSLATNYHLANGVYYYTSKAMYDGYVYYLVIEVEDNEVTYANIDKLDFTNGFTSFDDENPLVDSDWQLSKNGKPFLEVSRETLENILQEFSAELPQLLADFDYDGLNESVALSSSLVASDYDSLFKEFLSAALEKQVENTKDTLVTSIANTFIDSEKKQYKYLVVDCNSIYLDFSDLVNVNLSEKLEVKLDSETLEVKKLADYKYLITADEDYDTYGYKYLDYKITFKDYEYNGQIKVLVYSLKDYTKLYLQSFENHFDVYNNLVGDNYLYTLNGENDVYNLVSDKDIYVYFTKDTILNSYSSKYQIMNYDEVKDYVLTPTSDNLLSTNTSQMLVFKKNDQTEVISVKIRMFYDTYDGDAKYYNNWQLGESYKDYTFNLYPKQKLQALVSDSIDVSKTVTDVINNNTYSLFSLDDLNINGLSVEQSGRYYNESNQLLNMQFINRLTELEFANYFVDIDNQKIKYDKDLFTLELAKISVLKAGVKKDYTVKMVLNETRTKFMVNYYDSDNNIVSEISNISYGDDINYQNNIFSLPDLHDINVYTEADEVDFNRIYFIYALELNQLQTALFNAPFVIETNTLYINPSPTMTYRAYVDIKVSDDTNTYFDDGMLITTALLSNDVLKERFVSEIEDKTVDDLLYSMLYDGTAATELGSESIGKYLYPYISVNNYTLSLKDENNRIIDSSETLINAINDQLPINYELNSEYDITIKVEATFSIIKSDGSVQNTRANKIISFKCIMDVDKEI